MKTYETDVINIYILFCIQTNKSQNWTHFSWELRAKASCFSLETPNLSATFSEVMLHKQTHVRMWTHCCLKAPITTTLLQEGPVKRFWFWLSNWVRRNQHRSCGIITDVNRRSFGIQNIFLERSFNKNVVLW